MVTSPRPGDDLREDSEYEVTGWMTDGPLPWIRARLCSTRTEVLRPMLNQETSWVFIGRGDMDDFLQQFNVPLHVGSRFRVQYPAVVEFKDARDEN